ncbi:hypothetical protein Tcan_10585 [Toxocara canis]|uniref:Uncharacterized protein n=1 Tax=Toxocara canis TaxID=6265 RepID=A0A0B2UUA5_TOXCA|nr:hypothetical protein Tcan_10585 [Toxocara canis]
MPGSERLCRPILESYVCMLIYALTELTFRVPRMNNVPPVCFAGKFCEGRVPAGDYRHRHKPNEIAEERNEADALVGDLSNARKIGGIGVRNTNATSREAAPTNTSWYCLWYSHPGDSPGHANDHNKKDTKQVCVLFCCLFPMQWPKISTMLTMTDREGEK